MIRIKIAGLSAILAAGVVTAFGDTGHAAITEGKLFHGRLPASNDMPAMRSEARRVAAVPGHGSVSGKGDRWARRRPVRMEPVRRSVAPDKLDCADDPRLDVSMRTFALALFIPLLISASARADAFISPAIPPATPEPAPPKTKNASPAAVPTDVQTLRDKWMQCTAAAAKGDLRGSRPADEIADSALQRCRAQERPLARALSRQLGQAGAERVVEQLRETDRSNLIPAIEELR